MAYSKTSKEVTSIDGLFKDHNDVLNRLWAMGKPVAELEKALAQTDRGTNDTGDIIARLLNSGLVTKDELQGALRYQFDPQGNYQWPFTKVGTGKQPPNHYHGVGGAPGPGGGELPMHPQTVDARRAPIPIRTPPAPPNPNLGADRRPSGGGPGGGAPGVQTIVVQAPGQPETPKRDLSPAGIEKWVREKYGSYAWMLDDPNFAEVREVLLLAARDGLDEQGTVARLQNTSWWKNLDKDQRQYDILQRTDATTLNNMILTNQGVIAAKASQMGLDLTPQRVLELARDMTRNNWSDLEIAGALAGEAVYKPDFGGDIGAWEEKAKAHARDYLQPLSDEAAFDWAKKAAGGLIDEDNIKSYFIQQAVGLLPQYKDELETGTITARTLLNPQISTAAQLLEISEDEIDLIGDVRFSNIISNPEKRVLSVSETAKHVKGLDQYWKTGNAHKEVSGMVNGLARSFGKLA